MLFVVALLAIPVFSRVNRLATLEMSGVDLEGQPYCDAVTTMYRKYSRCAAIGPNLQCERYKNCLACQRNDNQGNKCGWYGAEGCQQQGWFQKGDTCPAGDKDYREVQSTVAKLYFLVESMMFKAAHDIRGLEAGGETVGTREATAAEAGNTLKAAIGVVADAAHKKAAAQAKKKKKDQDAMDAATAHTVAQSEAERSSAKHHGAQIEYNTAVAAAGRAQRKAQELLESIPGQFDNLRATKNQADFDTESGKITPIIKEDLAKLLAFKKAEWAMDKAKANEKAFRKLKEEMAAAEKAALVKKGMTADVAATATTLLAHALAAHTTALANLENAAKGKSEADQLLARHQHLDAVKNTANLEAMGTSFMERCPNEQRDVESEGRLLEIDLSALLVKRNGLEIAQKSQGLTSTELATLFAEFDTLAYKAEKQLKKCNPAYKSMMPPREPGPENRQLVGDAIMTTLVKSIIKGKCLHKIE